MHIGLSGGTGLPPALTVVTGLPDTCHEFAGYSVRSYDPVAVDVFNSVPENLRELGCAMILGALETRISLEGYQNLYEPCAVYDVYVNGESYRVQATAPDVPCGASASDNVVCEDFRYGTCPQGCVRECRPSNCRVVEGGSIVCTAACEGPGSCRCPRPYGIPQR